MTRGYTRLGIVHARTLGRGARRVQSNCNCGQAQAQTIRGFERLGTGLTDLITHCREAGLKDPAFDIDMNEFGIVIYRKGRGGVNGGVFGGVNGGVNGLVNGPVNGRVNGPVNGRVNGPVNGGVFGGVNGPVFGGVNADGCELLYRTILRIPGLRQSELCQRTRLSGRTIRRYLANELAGLVEFRGAPKTGGYYVKEEI